MQTLVVFDNEGKIFHTSTGSFSAPVGLKHIIIEMPDGKILKSVNPSTRQPVYEDFPKNESELLQERLLLAEQAIDFLIMGGI